MRLIDYFIKNKIVTLVLTLLIFFGGILSYMKLGKLEDPEFKVKEALVVTLYPGATPHEVELQVSDPLEQKIREMPKIESIESISKAGFSEIKVKIQESIPSKEVEQYWDILRRKVADGKVSLPPTAVSVVLDDYGDVYGMFFAVTAEGYSQEELNRYVHFLKKELEQVKGVSKASIYGKSETVIEVVIDRAKMKALGINDKLLYSAFLEKNFPMESKKIQQGEQTLRVNLDRSFQTIEEIENMVLFSSPNLLQMMQGGRGEVLRLKDIATVQKSVENPPKNRMRFSGKMAMGLQLSPEAGTNVVETGKKIDQKLEELATQLPHGIEVEKIYYQPDLVSSAISQFMCNLLASVAVVIGVLLFTMGIRSGLIIGSGLVLSIVGTFLFMLALKIDLQRVSLGAFIIAMGMLVDNSIVVVDGSLNALEHKTEPYEAMTLPTKKTAVPLLGATLVAIAAFLPMYLMKSSIGEYISSLFWVIAISLFLSWVFSMLQTPLFCYLYLNNPSQEEENTKKKKLYERLRKFLEKVLQYRKFSLLVLLGIFFVSLLLCFAIPTSFFPNSDKKGFVIDLWTPEGSTLEYTDNISKKVEEKLSQEEGILSYTALVGGSPARYYVATIPELPTSSLSQIVVNVKDLEEISRLEKEISDFVWEEFPDVNVQVKRYPNGIPTAYPVQLRITGADPEILRNLAREVEKKLQKMEIAKNINVDWKEKKLVLTPKIQEEKARQKGISNFDIANVWSRAGEGKQLGVFHEGTEKLPILLREKSGGSEINLQNLNQAPVFGIGMEASSLGEVILKNELQWENPIIIRHNGTRAIQVQCDVEEGIQPEVLRSALEKEIAEMKLPEGYHFSWNGEYYEQMKNIGNMLAYLPIQVVIMFIICLLLFATLTDPFIIFIVLPLSIIGIAPGLFITGRSFGFMAMIGAVSLTGMMIKNSIVLLDEIRYQKMKKDAYEAVVEASLSRVRAVSLAAGTTIFGMFPLMFDPLYGEMAITIIFGLTASTILTLFVVPLLYVSIHKIYKKSEER